MSKPRSAAERLDRAVDAILGGIPAPLAVARADGDAGTRRLVELADVLRTALAPPPVAPRYEARLGARLSAASGRDPVAWARRHSGRLIVTGAVGSAAVGVGVTALAVWRSSRRSSGAAYRLLHR